MAKRFTDTEKWNDEWFHNLSPVMKCVWFYLCDKCDNAGVWKVNKRLAEFQIGSKVKWEETVTAFQDRLYVVNEEKWLIVKFIDFQYGKLSEHCKPHQHIFDLLDKHNISYPFDTLSIPLANPYVRVQDKDKDKDKDKDNLKEGDARGTWKTDFSIYQAEEQAAYESLINDPVWIADRQKYHPNLDIKLSAEKAHKDYWSTEAAWSHKKKQRSKNCDWRRTYNNALTQRCNQVWKNKGPEMAGLFND